MKFRCDECGKTISSRGRHFVTADGEVRCSRCVTDPGDAANLSRDQMAKLYVAVMRANRRITAEKARLEGELRWETIDRDAAVRLANLN